MFGWLKNWTVNQSPADIAGISKAYLSLESGLKAVEAHWRLGQRADGDELIRSIVAACIPCFIEARANDGLTPEIKRAQLHGLQELLKFLTRHREIKLITSIANALPKKIKYFSPAEILQIQEFLSLAEESQSVAPKDRLVYYACQSYGNLNLLCTAPCLYCGFKLSNEKHVQRALLLSSYVMQTPALLAASQRLQSEKNDGVISLFKGFWEEGELGSTASAASSRLQGQFAFLLKTARENTDHFEGPPFFKTTCSTCQAKNSIATDQLDQECRHCKKQILIPRMRKIKAVLNDVLIYFTFAADPQNSIAYTNLFAALVLLNDYALRRDRLPTRQEIENIFSRLVNVAPITYYQDQLRMEWAGQKFVAHITPGVDFFDDEELERFTAHVGSVNLMLFTLRDDSILA